MLMQIYADVTGCTMQVAGSSQACALGSAVAATVLAGKAKGPHASFKPAQKAMTSIKAIEYKPIKAHQAVYDRLYALYRRIHDALGGVDATSNLGTVMKELLAIKEAASS